GRTPRHPPRVPPARDRRSVLPVNDRRRDRGRQHEGAGQRAPPGYLHQMPPEMNSKSQTRPSPERLRGPALSECSESKGPSLRQVTSSPATDGAQGGRTGFSAFFEGTAFDVEVGGRAESTRCGNSGQGW